MYSKGHEVIKTLKTLISDDETSFEQNNIKYLYNQIIPVDKKHYKPFADNNGFDETESKALEISCKINTFREKSSGKIRSIVDLNCDELDKENSVRQPKNRVKNVRLNCQISESSSVNIQAFPNKQIIHRYYKKEFKNKLDDNDCYYESKKCTNSNKYKELKCKKIEEPHISNKQSEVCSNSDSSSEKDSNKIVVKKRKKKQKRKERDCNNEPNSQSKKEISSVHNDQVASVAKSGETQTVPILENRQIVQSETIIKQSIKVDECCQTSCNIIAGKQENKVNVSMDDVVDKCVIKQQKLNSINQNSKCKKLLRLKKLQNQRKKNSKELSTTKELPKLLESLKKLSSPYESESELAEDISEKNQARDNDLNQSLTVDGLRHRHKRLSFMKNKKNELRKHEGLTESAPCNVSSLSDLIFCFYMLFGALCNLFIKLLALFSENLLQSYPSTKNEINKTNKDSKHENKPKYFRKNSLNKKFEKFAQNKNELPISNKMKERKKPSNPTRNNSDIETSTYSSDSTSNHTLDIIWKLICKCCKKVNEDIFSKNGDDKTVEQTPDQIEETNKNLAVQTRPNSLTNSVKKEEHNKVSQRSQKVKRSSANNLKNSQRSSEKQHLKESKEYNESSLAERQISTFEDDEKFMKPDKQQCKNNDQHFQQLQQPQPQNQSEDNEQRLLQSQQLAQQLQIQNQLQQLTMMQINSLLKLTTNTLNKTHSECVSLKEVNPEKLKTSQEQEKEKMNFKQKYENEMNEEKGSREDNTQNKNKDNKTKKESKETQYTNVASDGEVEKRISSQYKDVRDVSKMNEKSLDLIFSEIRKSLQKKIQTQQLPAIALIRQDPNKTRDFDDSPDERKDSNLKNFQKSSASRKGVLAKDETRSIYSSISNQMGETKIDLKNMSKKAKKSDDTESKPFLENSDRLSGKSKIEPALGNKKEFSIKSPNSIISKDTYFSLKNEQYLERVSKNEKPKVSDEYLTAQPKNDGIPLNESDHSEPTTKVARSGEIQPNMETDRSLVVSKKDSNNFGSKNSWTDDKNSGNQLKEIDKISSLLTPVPEQDEENLIDEPFADHAHYEAFDEKNDNRENENNYSKIEQKDIPEIFIPSRASAKYDKDQGSSMRSSEKKYSSLEKKRVGISKMKGSVKTLSDEVTEDEQVGNQNKDSDKDSAKSMSKSSYSNPYRIQRLSDNLLPEKTENKLTSTSNESVRTSLRNKSDAFDNDKEKSLGSLSLDAYFLKLQNNSEMDFNDFKYKSIFSNSLRSAQIENIEEKTTEALNEAIAQGALAQPFKRSQ
ncbi:hypothetical protein HELRODRAFT_160626 [Helobdella robusta]|uniref:Uncharacterized protein n=1 Tax=Helobdella robusta TaxID=6412 RepID=T1EQI5_HELRO|nr:hypothetical protein HELRODRAFT_160626 [Helobdella robusta]ESO06454.1 hypothetical protein HELRODRAFT_160626 [Helobdella robusta]